MSWSDLLFGRFSFAVGPFVAFKLNRQTVSDSQLSPYPNPRISQDSYTNAAARRRAVLRASSFSNSHLMQDPYLTVQILRGTLHLSLCP